MASKELRFLDDVATVTGLKGTDELLIVGDNVVIPGIERSVAYVRRVGTTGALVDALGGEERFDRVFVARENALDERIVLAATSLTKPGGLVCFFSEDVGLREAFRSMVELHFPQAALWDLQCNVGNVVVTDARTEE